MIWDIRNRRHRGRAYELKDCDGNIQDIKRIIYFNTYTGEVNHIAEGPDGHPWTYNASDGRGRMVAINTTYVKGLKVMRLNNG